MLGGAIFILNYNFTFDLIKIISNNATSGAGIYVTSSIYI